MRTPYGLRLVSRAENHLEVEQLRALVDLRADIRILLLRLTTLKWPSCMSKNMIPLKKYKAILYITLECISSLAFTLTQRFSQRPSLREFEAGPSGDDKIVPCEQEFREGITDASSMTTEFGSDFEEGELAEVTAMENRFKLPSNVIVISSESEEESPIIPVRKTKKRKISTSSNDTQSPSLLKKAKTCIQRKVKSAKKTLKLKVPCGSLFIDMESKVEGFDEVDGSPNISSENSSDRAFINDGKISQSQVTTENFDSDDSSVKDVIIYRKKTMNPLIKKALWAYAFSGNQECALEVEAAFPGIFEEIPSQD